MQKACNFEEALKVLCPKHNTQDKPANHSYANYHIMQAYRNQVYQNHQGGGGGNPGQLGVGGSGFPGAGSSSNYHNLGF